MSETLLNEIRATKPEAPSALRERVRALSVQEPAREPFLDRFRFNWGWRRLVLAVPATVVVALVAAGVIGLSRDGTRDEVSAAGGGERDRDELHVRALPDRGLGGAEGRLPGAAQPRDRDRPPGHGAASALRGGAQPAGRRRRGALDRDEAGTADRAQPRRQRRLAAVRRAVAGRRHRADHAPRPDGPRRERHGPALPARHDRRAALRDRRPAGSRPTPCSRRSRRRSGRSRSSSPGWRARRSPTPTAPSSSHGSPTPARS